VKKNTLEITYNKKQCGKTTLEITFKLNHPYGHPCNGKMVVMPT